MTVFTSPRWMDPCYSTVCILCESHPQRCFNASFIAHTYCNKRTAFMYRIHRDFETLMNCITFFSANIYMRGSGVGGWVMAIFTICLGQMPHVPPIATPLITSVAKLAHLSQNWSRSASFPILREVIHDWLDETSFHRSIGDIRLQLRTPIIYIPCLPIHNTLNHYFKDPDTVYVHC